jgi:methionyl-tRNA formyltransferase
MKIKVLFVGVDCDISRMIYHALKEDWQIERVIFEQPVSTKNKIKFRLKKLGVHTVIGEVLFKLVVDAMIAPFSKKRKKEILSHGNYSLDPVPASKLIEINDVHLGDWDNWLSSFQPDLILINGTRILKKSLLDRFSMPVVNIHAGITPMYRGVHGGYRALANNDQVNFGSTIHLVDPGVDTGRILKHIHVRPASNDNFYTYPYLQFATSIKELYKVVDEYLSGDKEKCGPASTLNPAYSKSWYYPTIFEYIYYRVTKGIK